MLVGMGRVGFFSPLRGGGTHQKKEKKEKHTPNVFGIPRPCCDFFVFPFVFGSLFLLMTCFFLEDYIQSSNRDVSSLARNRLLPGTPNNHEISWLFLLDHELQIFMTGKYVCFTIEPSI